MDTRIVSVLDARPSIAGEDFSRVGMTAAALAEVDRLWERNGPLMFHQSGGCCDGSSPMCYPDGDFITSDADVRLGVFDVPRRGELGFWMSAEQFAYWKHTLLTVDLVDGRGAGFSLEGPDGKRFLIRSRMLGE